MKDKIKNLTKQEVKLLKKHFKILKFNNDFDLVYESQIPNTAIVFLNGELALFKKKKIKFTVRPGSLLGLHRLLNNEPSKLGCRVKENSELIIIQKSDIIDALKDKSSELYDILNQDDV